MIGVGSARNARVVQVSVTRAPTQAWTAQQIRDATPFGCGPQFIVRDRDDKFGAAFDRGAAGAGARVVRTAVRAPLMNAVCERFLRSVRRECLDHVIILSERHLRHVLGEYALSYFNGARPHQGIGQRIPTLTERPQARLACSVGAIPVLGGLHHDYRAAAGTGGRPEEPGHALATRASWPSDIVRLVFVVIGDILGNKVRCASARAAHMVRSFQKGAEGLLEFLVIAEASRDFLGDEHGALRTATQTPAVRLNGALEPLRAQLRNLELIVLDVRHKDALREE